MVAAAVERTFRDLEERELRDARTTLRQTSRSFFIHTFDATVEDFLAITDEDLKCEYRDGELIVHSPASFAHEDVSAFLISFLRDYASRNRLGRVLGPNLVVQLSASRFFSPDISFLSDANAARVQDGRVMGPVDLAIEVLSKSTRKYDRGEKLVAYQQGRIPEIWLVDPDEKRFEAFVLCGDAYQKSELAAGDWNATVLPGLRLDVSWLWREELPSLDECRR
jgi:Uma2 family endonuclease